MVKKINIEDAYVLAEQHNGKCLSTVYVNSVSKLQWQCEKGHIFFADYSHVKYSNRWCKKCSIIKKSLSIEELYERAFLMGGQLVSREYVPGTKLEWRCANGHVFAANADSVKSGRWCPFCSNKAKLTIGQMHNEAIKHGGKCLSDKYINCNTKLEWECAFGHKFFANSTSVKSGRWCPSCFGNVKLTIEKMREVAELRGGKCLSETYKNNSTKLEWECSVGHRWLAAPSSVCAGSWCSACYKPNYNLEYVKAFASKKGGKCLSSKYINLNSCFEWECAVGHRWSANYYSAMKRWCLDCSGLTIDGLNEIAQKRGGKCLAEKYLGSNKKINWQCKLGHVWQAKPTSIKSGTWCPRCSGHLKTIDDMHEFAKTKSGKCLSIEYNGSRGKLKWECKNKHVFLMSPKHIKQDRWCPDCGSFFMQDVCREYLNELFDAKFTKIRPKWLKNPKTKYNLELDGYCAELNIAFEYNGQQHYYDIFKLGKEKLKQMQERDALKVKMCKDLNIKLIVIPFWENKNIKNFIQSEIKRLSIVVNCSKNIDIKEIIRKLREV